MNNNETALRLYKYEGETYCKMTDVLRMIHHEMCETSADSVRAVLSRMRFRLIRNDLISTTKGSANDNTCIPGRYAVAWLNGISYHYYTGNQDGTKPSFSTDSRNAKLYVAYRDASAAADFLDGHDFRVLDMHDFMSEGDRFRRELYIPYDADEGNENADRPDFLP